MITATRFTAGASAPERLDPESALREISTPGVTTWIDVVDFELAELELLDHHLGLGELLLEDLREGSADAGQRTKLRQHGRLFHVAVRDCSVLDGHLAEREIDLLFGDGWLCSVRHALDGRDRIVAPDPDPFPVDDIHRRLAVHSGHDAQFDEGFVLWAFLDVVTDRFLAVTDAIDERLDHAEALLLDDDDQNQPRAPKTPRELFDTGRLLTDFRHQVIPLREVVGALLRREDPAIGERALMYLRDVYDHLLGTAELVESQRDVLAGLRDVHLTVVSNRMNRSMQQLAAWGAILIVATLVTGILGMNFRDAPNVTWTTGFLAVVAVIAVLTVPMWWFFRRKGWV